MADFKTYGLTHIALAVTDIGRSVEFYCKVFGCRIMYRNDDFAQLQTPDTNDIIVFEKNTDLAGKTGGGIMHFGFRLLQPENMDIAMELLEAAGAHILEHGEFVPGEPYVFFKDPDGYTVEIWYEKINSITNY